jgi:hypothetical protein
VGHCGVVGALDWNGAMAAAAVNGGQWGRWRSGEESSSGKGNAAERRTVASKQDYWAAVKCVLRPGGVLRVPAGAGNDGKGVAAGGRFGNSWHAWVRAAGERNRAGAGRDGRVEVAPAGGGAAAAAERWPEAKHCRRQERKQSRARARGRRREGRGPGTCW